MTLGSSEMLGAKWFSPLHPIKPIPGTPALGVMDLSCIPVLTALYNFVSAPADRLDKQWKFVSVALTNKNQPRIIQRGI